MTGEKTLRRILQEEDSDTFMKTLSPDTHPDVERFHIELLRKASISHKMQMAVSLVKTTRQLSYQATL